VLLGPQKPSKTRALSILIFRASGNPEPRTLFDN
jgi:hypothetical protein